MSSTAPLVPEVINKGGRPKGSRNKDILRRMTDAESFASAVVDDPAYLKNLKTRARLGDLSPAVECLLMYYKFGKPVNRVEVSDKSDTDLSSFTIAEIAERCNILREAAVKLSSVSDDSLAEESEVDERPPEEEDRDLPPDDYVPGSE